METPTQTIRDTIYTIRKEADKTSYKALKIKHMEFYDGHPRLFDAAADVTFPLTYIDTMLDEREKLKSNQVDADTADKNIYGQLRAVYVDPLVNSSTGVVVNGADGADDVVAVDAVAAATDDVVVASTADAASTLVAEEAVSP